MFKLFYSINDVFASKFGYYKDGSFVFSHPYDICIIEKKNGKYRSIFPEVSEFYTSLDKATEEEKENVCMWGRMDSIRSYLNDKEIKEQKVSIWRLSEICKMLNGEVIDNTPKRKLVPGVLEFKSRI